MEGWLTLRSVVLFRRAQSKGLQPGAKATFFRLDWLPSVAPLAPPTPSGAVRAEVLGGAMRPPPLLDLAPVEGVEGGASPEGGGMRPLLAGRAGLLDKMEAKAPAFDEVLAEELDWR